MKNKNRNHLINFIIIFFIIFVNDTNTEEYIFIKCNSIIERDSLFFEITIKNNIKDEYSSDIYIPISEWFFSGDKKSDVIKPSLFPPWDLLNIITYYPMRYDETKADMYDGETIYKPVFLPKIIEIKNGDSLVIRLKKIISNKEMFIESEDYKIDFSLSYSTGEYISRIFHLYPNLYNYILEDNNILIDLNVFKNLFYNKYNYKNYTNLRIDDCLLNLLKLCFLKRLQCQCKLKR